MVERVAHLSGRDDGRVSLAPFLERCAARFGDLIKNGRPADLVAAFRAPRRSRPLGAAAFPNRVAKLVGRDPRPRKRRPKRKKRKGIT